MDQTIALFLGWLASHLQGKNNRLSKNVKFAMAFFICVVAGLMSTSFDILLGNKFDPTELMGNIGLSFTASQTYYNTYFKRKDG